MITLCGLCTFVYYYFFRKYKRKEGSPESRWNLWREKQKNKDALNIAVNNITFNEEFGEFETFNPLPKVVEKVQKKKNKFVDNTLIVPQAVTSTENIQQESEIDNQTTSLPYNTVANPLIKMGRNPLKNNPTVKIKADETVTTTAETRPDEMVQDVDL